MRKISWIYLVLYACDGLLTASATIDQSYRAFNSVFSTVVVVSSIIVLVLSMKNHLHPRWLFQLLSIYYLFISYVLMFALGGLLVSRVGLENIPAEVTPEFIASHLPWYWTLHWGIILSIFVLALIGFRTLKSEEENALPEAQAGAFDARFNQGAVGQRVTETSVNSEDEEMATKDEDG